MQASKSSQTQLMIWQMVKETGREIFYFLKNKLNRKLFSIGKKKISINFILSWKKGIFNMSKKINFLKKL